MFKRYLKCKKVIAAILSAAVITSNLSGALPVMAVSSNSLETESVEEQIVDEAEIQEVHGEEVHGEEVYEEEVNGDQEELDSISPAELLAVPEPEVIKEVQPEEVAPQAESIAVATDIVILPQADSNTIIWDEDKEEIDLPKRYSAIDQGFTPAIRNQAPYGNCWSHAGIACLEIGMLRNKLNMGIPAEQFELSIPHAIYYGYRPVTDPLGLNADDVAANSKQNVTSMLDGGGAPGYIGTTAFCWLGPILNENFHTFSQLETYYATVELGASLATKEKAYDNRVATVTEMVEMDRTEWDEIKRGVLKYGAVATGHLSGGYFSHEHSSQYTPNSGSTNHAITIVGWNDDFPKENFTQTAPGNGAWLIRNSAGTGYGDKGYFWLSYYDKTMDGGTAFKVEAPDKYDNNYFYDMVNKDYTWVECNRSSVLETANVYTIQKEKELLKAVQFDTFQDCYSYSIQIYLNPTIADNPSSGTQLLDAPITGYKKLRGTYTIDLEKPVWVKKDDKIAVCVTVGATPEATLSPMAETDRNAASLPDRSYYRINQGTWTDCADAGKGNFIIRMFTDNDENNIGENHTHSWSSDWKYDGDYHWHECSGDGTCNAHTTDSGRGYQKHYGGTANCTNKARCEGCGQEYGYILDYAHVGDSVCTICSEPIDPKDRQGVKNPEYEFTTINDTKISSKVNKKPRLLIFFGSDCARSKATVASLTTERLSGVDIVAVDVALKPKDKVQEFANINVANPGNQDITFCYWGTENDTVRWAYANAYKAVYPDSLSAALPEIYYIDETNTIKYATTGTQTLAQIKENLISYAGYKVAGLNKDNPSAMEFTTIDDTTVSATANGRPKVLVLGNNDGVARDTLTSFENKFPDGVDIYFVNIAGNDKDQTTEFKNTVKSNGKIVYCYDVYGRYIELADEYLRAANLMSGQNQGYATPVICYIDAENKLQYVTKGESNGDQLLNILKSSCFYEEGQGEDVEEVQSLILQKPTKTVYLTGESLSVEGGQVGLTSDSMTALTTSMVSGFNSRQPGIQYLTVTHEGVTVQFSVIVVEVPQVTAKVGDTLSSINLPVYTYGVYSWKNSGTTLETKGNQSFEAIFTPTDIVNYSVRNGIQIQVEVTENETPVTPPSVEEKYIVTFNYGGKLDNETVEVKKGENVTQPDITTVEGFEFKGWYKEETFITPWNFESDTVTKDLTLYAKWETKSVDPGEPEDPVLPESKVITVAPIADLVYTGKALKPVVQVYDGEKLLQLNKDYKVTYKNNVNANAGAVQAGEEFNENLPSVIITGKGNYSGTLQVNFNILPIEIRDEKDVIDSGLKVNITDQLVVNTKKAVAPLKSVSFGKTLKEGQDYTFTLSCMNATDSEGQPITGRLDDGKIPAGAKGRFTMIIKFEGNYRGVATYFISVAEKTELIKNAAVTLKKEFKSIDFEAFNNGYANKMLEEGFEVKMGQTLLEPSKDYGATWANIDKIGTATLIISGSGNYKGTKAVNFKLTGKALTASKLTLENFGNLTYTGEPLAQKDLIIKYEGKPLTEGTDYIVSYTKNDKVGTAAMTITAKEGSYYQGSVKKTFKIAAADITQVKQPEAITVPYSKAGARPVAEVVLENALGQRLVNGKDYTLSYKNNKNVAEANSSNGPVVVVKGKGNYTGTLEIPFTITKADLSDLGITVKAVAYNAKKADSYAYQPAVTIKDGSKTLSSKTDYTVEYENNTQAAYKAYYLDKIEGAPKPVVKITARKVSSYTTEEPVIIELPVYRIKLTSKNVYAVISETSYTGKQATPEVELYYSADHKVIKDIKAKGLTSQAEIEAFGLVRLDKADYQVSYGTNIFGGVNKGSLKIEGRGALYGGSVSLKFNIGLRDLNN